MKKPMKKPMKKLSILSVLAGTALFCAVPVSLQLSQDRLSVSLDSASAEVWNPLTPGSVAGVHRRVERRAARRAYRAGYGYGGYRYGRYGGYGYGMVADGVVGTFAGGTYSVGGNYDDYPTRAIYNQSYIPPGYYGPVCNPAFDHSCQ
jgi:hypothetical protein